MNVCSAVQKFALAMFRVQSETAAEPLYGLPVILPLTESVASVPPIGIPSIVPVPQVVTPVAEIETTKLLAEHVPDPPYFVAFPAESPRNSADCTLETMRSVVDAVTAVSAVVEAYGNCDAATVDDAVKIPAVCIGVEVAADVVEKKFAKVNIGPGREALVMYPESFVHCEIFAEVKFVVDNPETFSVPPKIERPEPVTSVTLSAPMKRLLVESAVVDAYGNCDAAVDDEKKEPPLSQMLLVVATVEVEKVLVPKLNGVPPPAPSQGVPTKQTVPSWSSQVTTRGAVTSVKSKTIGDDGLLKR